MSEPKRKLTFQRDAGLGKLKLRFEDGELSLELSKHRSTHRLTREQAQELALWLSAWSLKLIDDATKAEAAADEGRADTGGGDAADGAKRKKKKPEEEPKKEKEKERKKGKKGEKGKKRKDDADAKGGRDDAPHARADAAS